MVRFIIFVNYITYFVKAYIYIPIWLDLLSIGTQKKIAVDATFTFQYGQIYYKDFPMVFGEIKDIYIPIWLDLLFAIY